MEELNYNLESDDEFIFTEVIAGFLQDELAKEINQLQMKSLNAVNYNRKKHLVSFLLHAREKSELDEFKDLFDANLNYDDSLLRNSTDSECLLVKTSSNYLSKLCVKLIDETMLKCVEFLEYMMTDKENGYAGENDANTEIKREKQFVPRPQFSMVNLNKCSYCNFKHFSKSVVQCHMSKNHLQHLRIARLNRNLVANNNVNANLAETTTLTLSDMINENIVYNNQNDLNISLNNSLYNALGNGDDDDDDENGAGVSNDDIEASADDVVLEANQHNNIVLSNATNNNNTISNSTNQSNAKLPCPYCDKSFTYQSLLTQHIRIHTGEKPFKCKVCSKQFSQRPTLNRHFKIHTNDRAFSCELCGKSFLHRCNLTKHMESHMRPVDKKISSILAATIPVEIDLTKEKPSQELKKDTTSNTNQIPNFYCMFCSKAFTYQSQLDQHQRIHTGERPFKCNICEKSFSQRPTLTRHMKVHSGRKTRSNPWPNEPTFLKIEPTFGDACELNS